MTSKENLFRLWSKILHFVQYYNYIQRRPGENYNVYNIKQIRKQNAICGKYMEIQYIAKRNYISLKEKIDYIWNNYTKIQKEIDENKLPTKKSMIEQISNIIKN